MVFDGPGGHAVDGGKGSYGHVHGGFLDDDVSGLVDHVTALDDDVRVVVDRGGGAVGVGIRPLWYRIAEILYGIGQTPQLSLCRR